MAPVWYIVLIIHRASIVVQMRNLVSSTLCVVRQIHDREVSSRVKNHFVNSFAAGTGREPSSPSAVSQSHDNLPVFHHSFTMPDSACVVTSCSTVFLSVVTNCAAQQPSASVILTRELESIQQNCSDLQVKACPGDKPRHLGVLAPAVWAGLGLCSDLLGLDQTLAVLSRGVASGPGPPTRLVTALGSGTALAPGSRLNTTVSKAAEATQWQQEAQAPSQQNHAPAHTHSLTHPHTRMNKDTSLYTHTPAHTYTRTHAPIHTHTYTHTHPTRNDAHTYTLIHKGGY